MNDKQHAGHQHGPLTPANGVVIEVCTGCRGTIGDRTGLSFRPGKHKGHFGTVACAGCAAGLEEGGRLAGLVPVRPLFEGDRGWRACQHIAQEYARQDGDSQ